MTATDIISLKTKGFTDVLDISDAVTKIVKQSGNEEPRSRAARNALAIRFKMAW